MEVNKKDMKKYKVWLAYYPAKSGPEAIMTKSEKDRDKIQELSPLLKFEEVELEKAIYDELPMTCLQKL